MVSVFLMPSCILRVPDHISNEELLNNSIWPNNTEGEQVREAIEYLEYGKDNNWTGEKILMHIKKIVILIIDYAFPDFEAVSIFDNLSNHLLFAPDALLVLSINLNLRGKQPKMHDG